MTILCHLHAMSHGPSYSGLLYNFHFYISGSSFSGSAYPVNPYRNKAVREAATICPRPCKLTFGLLILKVVSESRVKWAASVPILVFLGLSVLDLGPMYATDRQTSDAHHRLMPPLWGQGLITHNHNGLH